MIETLQTVFLYLMLAVLVFNMTQRSHLAHGEKKRIATLSLALLLLLSNVVLAVVGHFRLSQWYLLPGLLLVVFTAWVLRERIFIYHLRCPDCSRPYVWRDVLYRDRPQCSDCSAALLQSVADIDWESWQAAETAVLCFVREDSRIMLIHKKTGLGAGKINAPGGRIEPGETALQAAIRETEEETGIIPAQLREMVRLNFQFRDGYALRGHVFMAEAHSGVMTETDEADPFWCEVDEIPFDRMWADDVLWVPNMLNGLCQEGWFIFDGDTMVDSRIEQKPGFD